MAFGNNSTTTGASNLRPDQWATVAPAASPRGVLEELADHVESNTDRVNEAIRLVQKVRWQLLGLEPKAEQHDGLPDVQGRLEVLRAALEGQTKALNNLNAMLADLEKL